MIDKEKIYILGLGLSGMSLAIYLKKKKYHLNAGMMILKKEEKPKNIN